MQCPRCKQENREGRRFCAECGASLALPCQSCGFSNEPGEKFCGGCGTQLEIPPRAAIGSRFSSPESYTPKHLIAKILTSKAALEGERKQVTVLSADGAPGGPRPRGCESAARPRRRAHGGGRPSLRHGEPGDGRRNHGALRRAARARGSPRPRRQRSDSGRPPLWRSRRPRHRERPPHGLHTAVGQTTHLAARMEQLATPGTVLLTAGILRLAEGFIAVKPLSPVPVKGLDAPVDVYGLTGAGSLRSRLHAAAARGD